MNDQQIPAELLDQLTDVGNKALNDHHHDDLCGCPQWPESCRHYPAGIWDTNAFVIALPAIIAAYENQRPTNQPEE